MKFIDETPVLAALNYAKGQVLYRAGLRRHRSGSTSQSLSVDGAVAYIRTVIGDYIAYGAGGDRSALTGMRVLEVGPGDNLGVALLLVAAGAESVTCVDGFAPAADQRKNRRIYAALYAGLTDVQRARLADTLVSVASDEMEIVGGRVRSFYGVPIERPHRALSPTQYDVVLSRAVLEHVSDVNRAWQCMVDSLVPDGQMWHKIDFRSHKLFQAIHPLYFLTLDEWVWRLVSRPDPTLNRARLPEYRALTDRQFQHSTIRIASVLDEPEIQPHPEQLVAGTHYDRRHLATVNDIRPHLKEPFSSYRDEDLLISGVFIVSRGKRSR